jgi:hypothetical protein
LLGLAGRAGTVVWVGSAVMLVLMPGLSKEGAASSVAGGMKLKLNVIGGGDLEERRGSLRREAFLAMAGRRALLTERTIASTEAQTADVPGRSGCCSAARRAVLLLETSANARTLAEPTGAIRLELVSE